MTADRIVLKWRTVGKGVPPRRVKVTKPGWAGADDPRADGSVAQPWHCPPFLDGCRTGFELLYPFDQESHVTCEDGLVSVNGEPINERNSRLPFAESSHAPGFLSFVAGYYAMTSLLDLEPPAGYSYRVETHPRYYTDRTGTVPLAMPANIAHWWSHIFFLVFVAPRPGEMHIFRKEEPYAQLLVIPSEQQIDLEPMTEEEVEVRQGRELAIDRLKAEIATQTWKDNTGHQFGNHYTTLRQAYQRGGDEAIQTLLREAARVQTEQQQALIARAMEIEIRDDFSPLGEETVALDQRELKRYLLMHVFHPRLKIPPSPMICRLWKSFAAHEKRYRRFWDELGVRPIPYTDYTPLLPRVPPRHIFPTLYLKLYRELPPEPYWKISRISIAGWS